MRIGMEVLFHVCLLLKKLVTDGTILPPRKEYVKKGKATILFNFHGELDGI